MKMTQLNVYDIDAVKARMNLYGPTTSCSVRFGNSRFLGYYELKKIVYAHEHGIDISLLVDPTGNPRYQFDFYQMVEIIKGVEAHIDISIYRDAKYDSCQMHEIRLGLMDGLDVSYDHPCILTDVMKKMYSGEWDISRKEAIKISYEWYPTFVDDIVRERNLHGQDLREVREAIKGIVK